MNNSLLSHSSELPSDQSLNRQAQIRIIKHDERCIPTQLHRQLLHHPRLRARLHQQLANRRRSGEGDFFDRVGETAVVAESAGVRFGGDDVEDSVRDTGTRGENRVSNDGKGSLRRRLDDCQS